MIEEEYKENVEYIRSTILPQLQEIQRDLAENLPGVSLIVRLDGDTGTMSAHAAVFFDGTANVKDICTVNFFYVDNKEKIDDEYNKLAEFLKKYIA
jgi:hypothetical protein